MSLDSPSSVSMSSGEASPTAGRESVASDDEANHDVARRDVKSSGKHSGRCDLILGPMFSGKSTEMLRRIRRYTIAQKHCLVIKYARDTRYSVDKLATHDRMMWDSFPACRLADVPASALADVEVVGIDEGQFFPDLVEWCDEQVNVHKRVVIVAALDGTFQRKPFGRVLDLVPNCDSLTKLVAVCMMCGEDAPFTARTTQEQEVEVIGGAEKYSAVCRKCFDMWA